jgi:hypothetical protein
MTTQKSDRVVIPQQAAHEATAHRGLDALSDQGLLGSIWRRRTHRVSRGSSIDAGTMSWTSEAER